MVKVHAVSISTLLYGTTINVCDCALSTDPVEWAAKAAQWAQQRQIQDHYYHQQTVTDQQLQQQQQQQMLQQHQMEQIYSQQQFPGQQQAEYAQQDLWSQQQQQVQQQVQQAQVETALLPKPLFETQQSHSPRVHQGVEPGGAPSNLPSFHGSPHGTGEDAGNYMQPSGVRIPHPQGPRGFGPRGSGNFSPRVRGERFHSPRGRGGFARPIFSQRGSPRGSPPFRHPHSEGGGGGRSPHGERTISGGHRGGPTAEHFDRAPNFDGNLAQEGSDTERDQPSRQSNYVEQLEAARQKELEKERELKRTLQRMQEVERQRKMEIEKNLEMVRRQKEERERAEKRKWEEEEAAKRAKELEELQRKRLEEEAIAKREAEELEKKRQLDMQLAQEIENKRREMERILEQKERMERELMERQAELGRVGRGGEGWGPSDDYQSEQGFPGQEGEDGPTIPSWSSDPSSIPGLGELDTETESQTMSESAAQEKQPGNQPTESQGQPPKENLQMVESLGKIVSQLQTLQGLTSSLKLLQTMPKEGGGVSEKEKAAMREKELSEDTKRKVAALLANESDSDGEKVLLMLPM